MKSCATLQKNNMLFPNYSSRNPRISMGMDTESVGKGRSNIKLDQTGFIGMGLLNRNCEFNVTA